MIRSSYPRANRTPIHIENTCKPDTPPPENTCKPDTHTYRRQVVIKTGSRSDWPCGNKIKESKARIEGGSAAATRPLTHPLSLSERLYGPVFAVKGSASRPLTAPGRAWGLAVYEGKGGNCNGGESPPGPVAQRSGFATPRPRTGFQGVRRCETVLQEKCEWR